jgi:hypothetical protein
VRDKELDSRYWSGNFKYLGDCELSHTGALDLLLKKYCMTLDAEWNL